MGIACVQWDCFDPGRQTDWKAGPIPIRRLGYFWWDYNGYNGELQYIRFEKQIFFPPNAIATGYSWQLEPGVRGDFNVTFTKLDELPVAVINQAIQMGAGKIAGLGNISSTGMIQAPTAVTKIGTNARLKGYISNR